MIVPSQTTKPDLIDEAALQQAAECLRTIAHPDRLRLIDLLLQGRFAVGELAELCDLAPAVTSEHLRLMQRLGLLKSERQGRKMYYAVAEPHLSRIMDCVRSQFGARS